MAVGQVSFHNDKKVPLYLLTILYLTYHITGQTRYSVIKSISLNRRIYAFLDSVHVANRENVIVNRLSKTKVEREVDHEQERVDRIKRENAVKRAAAAEKVFNFKKSFWSYSNSAMFSCDRKSKMQNWRKEEKKKRLLDHTILCLMWRKTRVCQERRSESWKRISCRYQVRRILICNVFHHGVWKIQPWATHAGDTDAKNIIVEFRQ